MKATIQSKILWLTISILVCSTLILGGICTVVISNQLQDGTIRNIETETKFTAANISLKMQAVEHYIMTLASSVERELKDASKLQDSAYLENFTEAYRTYINNTIENVPKTVAVYIRYNPQKAPPTSGIFMAKAFNSPKLQKYTPTDFSKYDPNDIEHVGWYYEPVRAKRPIWMLPYKNKNISINMISYVIPIFKNGEDIAVVGLDQDFDDLTKNISNLKFFPSSYAYLEEADGKIAYHPTLPKGHFFEETEDVKVFRSKLTNGMNLAFVIPYKEINSKRNTFIVKITASSLGLILIFSLIAIFISRSITKPIKILTKKANQLVEGDMSVEFDISQDNEIGELAKSFSTAKNHLQNYLGQIRGMAFKDSLTSVRNSMAYNVYIKELQEKILRKEVYEFGFCLLDTNDLKKINDTYGHEQGNIYLIKCCKLICQTFSHSPVFRIGGDEFVVVLLNSDLENREELRQKLKTQMEATMQEKNPWDRLSIACGIAVCEGTDDTTLEIFNRADKEMYKNKLSIKGEGK